MDSSQIKSEFRNLQLYICQALEKVDGLAKFQEDAWTRSEGGGGFTRTMTNGTILEKGGVAFSAVEGAVSEAMKKQLGMEGESFFASGVSIVLHPFHPRHPIIHMNVRYFELDNGTYWFGGGIDLTPHYINENAARLFHQGLKALCDQFQVGFYTKFKPWADTYFHLPHRGESRGIGGIFFDHLDESCGLGKAKILEFCIALGHLFPILYAQQVDFMEVKTPTEPELAWQATRRSRYVEFNLLHDRGTKFGIYSGGRTESILMSMPPMAKWEYNALVAEDSEENKTIQLLKNPINWI